MEKHVDWAAMRRDSGLSAMSKLGLHQLKSHERIRKAIESMAAPSGKDPWAGQGEFIENVDLVRFFALIEDQRISFSRETLASVVDRVRETERQLPE